jgi:peptidoglycan/LPS O-acetylase OafA/YrhL
LNPAQPKSRYRPSIDGLRAVAVLLVIGYHAFPSALPGGFVGVDMFFVISGFLISGILYGNFSEAGARGTRVIREFYGRRIRRIFPALSLVLFACYLIGFGVLLPQEFSNLCRDVAESAGFCLNLALAGRTGYFEPESASLPLLHIWSLGVEEQFYLLWPLVIWAACRMRIRVLPVSVFIGGSSFFWTIYHMSAPAGAAFFLPQTRLWELLIGAAAAAVLSEHGTAAATGGRVVRELCAFAGSGMIVAGVAMVTRDSGPPNARTLLPTLGTVLVICAGEESLVGRGILSRKIPVWIGLISYPLYLWHWPLLTFTRLTSENGGSPVHVLGAIAVSALLAWATYRFLEYPVRHGPRSALKVAVPFAAVLATGLLGFFSFRQAGFPWRVPPILRDPNAAVEGHEIPWRAGDYFLKAGDTGDNFKVDKNEILPGRPTLFLWGDSHAASLYPGYAKYFARSYNLVQRTVQGTAPILGLDFPTHPNSRSLNDYIFASIQRAHPDCVVLSANWLTYDWTRLTATIRALKSAGVGHIVVIGPLPQWKGLGLPQQLYNYYRTHFLDRLPVRMTYGVEEGPIRVDSQMRKFCAAEGVDYVSPCMLLSNKDGFITRVGDTPESIVAFDYGHLTKAGSEYLVSKFPGASQ